MHIQDAHSICKEHLYRYVRVQVAEGYTVDGIIEHVDEHNLYLAVPIGPEEGAGYRAFYPGYYGGFYPPYPPYYSPYYYSPYFFPGRRFRRVVLPLASFVALSLLPYI
ncbi:hypothetical protein [Paenibacillus flagellatus]|uniref:Phosphatidylinositol kinase n=1 Tax=Paenibacillus flagellatus TaxID=2211139 RepID=A0A2V5KLT2_9BACL|nr:hypothetical protein [Paenibacillus flagellatus]PYI51787.1 hypothetical protein DLM86_22970 [Paenibacillus flagellatus]